MSRSTERLAAAVFALLVLASFAAFFVTQHLKHSPTPVQETTLLPIFAPQGVHKVELLSFKSEQTDRVTVSIVDATGGGTVRTLVKDRPVLAYHHVYLHWNGRGTGGAPAPAGVYKVRVYLEDAHREVFFPETFKLAVPGDHAANRESSKLRYLRHHETLVALALAAAAIIVAVLAVLFYRRPEALALAAVIALPFRLPIANGESTSNLLIPLYLVVAAGVLAQVLRRMRAPPRAPDPGRAGRLALLRHLQRRPRLPERAELPALLEWLLAISVALYAVQAAYSTDFGKAVENIVFFYVPFGLLFMLLRRLHWTRRLLLGCLGAAVVLALALSGVGFIEYARKQLFLNPKVVAADENSNYFRVNSVFFDPNIYGRFLALVMIGVMTVVLAPGGDARSRHRTVLGGAVALAWLWCGLVTSFSQSSIAALLLGLAILAAWRWDARSAAYVAVALVVIAGVLWVAAPASLHFGLHGSGGSADNATNGRTNLISGGLHLFADRPLEGFGSGSFADEYVNHHLAASGSSTTDSHTIPVTIAAEQGVIGLLLYIALLVGAFAMLLAPDGRDGGLSPARILIAACFAGLVLHTWVYADFLEDPMTWLLLGIGAALAADRGGRGAAAQWPAAKLVARDLAELAPGGVPE